MSDKPYNKIRDIIAGLNVFFTHGGDSVDASHDELRSGQGNGQVLSEEELKTLDDAGWFRAECQCDVSKDEGGDEVGEHEPDCNDWMIYT